MDEQDEKSEWEKEVQRELNSCEHQSDRRTAAFVERRMTRLQEQLCDLIADMRTFEHYAEIDDVSFCLRLMQKVKKRYRSFSENGVWPEST